MTTTAKVARNKVDEEADNKKQQDQHKKLKRPDKPQWIEKELSGTYCFVYSERVPDNEPALYTNTRTEDNNKDSTTSTKQQPFFHTFGTAELTFQDDGKSAVIAGERGDEPTIFEPVGKLSNGMLEYEGQHWLKEFEWRPCDEYLRDEDLRNTFVNYSATREAGEHDGEHFDDNYIEFTIDATIAEGRFEWEFLDETALEQIPNCLRAHYHLISRHVGDEDGEQCRESYILCRKDDFDRVKCVILDSLKRGNDF